MPYLNYEKSFIASVQCVTPDYCGFWDCAELVEGDAGVERKLGDWLTVHNCPQAENHLFRFDCYYDANGYCGYVIQSHSKSQGRAWSSTGIRFGFSTNGYVALYPVKGGPNAFWKPKVLRDGAETDLIDSLSEGVIDNVRVRSPDTWTLKALKRVEIGDYWHVYVNDAEGPTMNLSLHIQSLGFEDLDDH
ncbi:hypothetical protein SFA35_05185 [Pseudomonas sp. HR96]|uniref:hypothetical protein n=1 Tax=Pseudomonas sp. HR96 TaxID=1027966 RepID=UPI002A7534FB|nr:hypothetical protein [Pseudomonas sp. HR96]WPP00770.1 hypothetical protein SFA35_05185 [Pseudomonas sp. HR96]